MNGSMSPSASVNEQRRHARVAAIYPLEFWVPGLGTAGSGKTRNVSAGGLQFLAAQALLPGTELRLRILAGRHGRPCLDLPASVVRCTPRGTSAFAISCATG